MNSFSLPPIRFPGDDADRVPRAKKPATQFFYSSNSDREMEVVCELLRRGGVDAEIVEFEEPEEWRGLLGVFVPEDEDTESLWPLVEKLRDVRWDIQSEDKANRNRARVFSSVLLAFLLGLAAMYAFAEDGESPSLGDFGFGFGIALMLVFYAWPFWATFRRARRAKSAEELD